MAGFTPEHDDFQAIVYRIASQVSGIFQDAETRLLAEIARRLLRDLPERPELGEQLRIVQDLERYATALTDGITRDFAEDVVARAAKYGASATVRLPRLPQITQLTDGHVLAAALTAFDLGNKFADMRARILRYPRNAMGEFLIGGDVYQDVIAGIAPSVALGSSTAAARSAALQEFLARGVTGFTDIAGRNWRIGTYAEMATRTAVTRAFTDAKVARSAEVGIDLFSVLGGRNACPNCAQWFGKIIASTGPAGPRDVLHAVDDVTVTVQVAGSLADWRASGANHPNCFPGFVPVGSPTGIAATDARWFEGEVVVIHTAGGRELTVTPNHPVLTNRGWVSAGALVEGDNLVSYHGGVEFDAVETPDHVGRESPICEVFESLGKSREVATILVPGAPEQFHGDGADSEVHVVLADRLLRNDGEPLFDEDLAEAEFLLRRVRERSLLAERSQLKISLSSLHAAHGVMGGRGVRGPFAGSQLLGVRELGFGSVTSDSRVRDHSADGHASDAQRSSDLGLALPAGVERDDFPLSAAGANAGDRHSHAAQSAADYILGDAYSAADLRDGLAGLVSLEKVVQVDRRRFAGHVYNLQTGGGWYTADSIVVHNCTCLLTEYLPGFSIPTAASAYDPAAHAARDRLRDLEVRERDAKRRLLIAEAAGDEDRARRYRARVLKLQAETREHVRTTGQTRRYERAQIRWADGERVTT